MTGKVSINLSGTDYEIVGEVAESLGWKRKYDQEDNDQDVVWQDNALTSTALAALKPFQRVNHFPGMYAVARKDYLGRHFKYMRNYFPEDYNFFPETWILPRELNDFKHKFNAKNIYIVKPEASSQGQGIFLTNSFEDLPERCVVQDYITNPFLIEGLKFDLRIYLLVTTCDPLRVFIHKEGLVRLATQPYKEPKNSNLDSLYMHLTNYAINKNNPGFRQNRANTYNGHKRSLSQFMKKLAVEGYDAETLWGEICDISAKTMCMVQPLLEHLYRASQPNDPSNMMCFQILGLDILLDENLKPYVLEVNHTPSFATDSSLDYSVKFAVISDALGLLGLKKGNKTKYLSRFQSRIFKRAFKGIQEMRDYRSRMKEKANEKREKIEVRQTGRFVRILPRKNDERYSDFMRIAKDALVSNASLKVRLSRDREITESQNFLKKRTVKININNKLIRTDMKKSSSVKRKMDSRKRLPPIKLDGSYIRPKIFTFENCLSNL